MPHQSTTPSYRGEIWLSLDRLHELVVPDGRTFLPFRVAKEVLYSEPLLVSHERNDVFAILSRLIEEAEQRLKEEGAEPAGSAGAPQKLHGGLRREALWLGALYTYALSFGDMTREMIRLAERGNGWPQLSGDHLQASIHWLELGKGYAATMQPIEALEAMRTALAHAERSGDRELQLRIVNLYANGLLRQERGDEVPAILKRGMKILESDPPIEGTGCIDPI